MIVLNHRGSGSGSGSGSYLTRSGWYLARAVLKVIWSKEKESKEREEKKLQPVFQAEKVPGGKGGDEGDHGDQAPLQAGKHLEGLSKGKGTCDDHKHRPESLGAEDQGEEAEEEEEELHEGGEDRRDHLLRIRQTVRTVAISLQIPGKFKNIVHKTICYLTPQTKRRMLVRMWRQYQKPQ